MTDDEDKSDDTIVSLRPGKPSERIYERTLTSNSRRYGSNECNHKGPYTFDRKLATVECGDCGALLNPLYVIEMLAAHEAYWNQRQKDL